MNRRFLFPLLFAALALLASACSNGPATPTVDVVGTSVAGTASVMLAQTAAAASPTPLPPTETPVPTPTEVLPTETATPSGPPMAVANKKAACWFGPGSSYPLESNISNTKKLELLGVGSVNGWYIVKNPYFYQPCWISADDVDIDPSVDISSLPVITPGH